MLRISEAHIPEKPEGCRQSEKVLIKINLCSPSKEYLATCIQGVTFRSVVGWPLFCSYSTREQKGKEILQLRTKKVLV